MLRSFAVSASTCDACEGGWLDRRMSSWIEGRLIVMLEETYKTSWVS
jgi:hypothetical protein